MTNGKHDVYLVDYRLGEHNGIELLEEIRRRGNRTPAIFLTGHPNYDVGSGGDEGGGGRLSRERADKCGPSGAVDPLRYRAQAGGRSAAPARGAAPSGAKDRRRSAHLREALPTTFNNILAAILGNTEIALEDTPEDGPRHNLQQILRATVRGRDLVKQILTYSRKSEKERNMLQLSPLIKETFTLLRLLCLLPSKCSLACAPRRTWSMQTLRRSSKLS